MLTYKYSANYQSCCTYNHVCTLLECCINEGNLDRDMYEYIKERDLLDVNLVATGIANAHAEIQKEHVGKLEENNVPLVKEDTLILNSLGRKEHEIAYNHLLNKPNLTVIAFKFRCAIVEVLVKCAIKTNDDVKNVLVNELKN